MCVSVCVLCSVCEREKGERERVCVCVCESDCEGVRDCNCTSIDFEVF